MPIVATARSCRSKFDAMPPMTSFRRGRKYRFDPQSSNLCWQQSGRCDRLPHLELMLPTYRVVTFNQGRSLAHNAYWLPGHRPGPYEWRCSARCSANDHNLQAEVTWITTEFHQMDNNIIDNGIFMQKSLESAQRFRSVPAAIHNSNVERHLTSPRRHRPFTASTLWTGRELVAWVWL